ncbi:CbtB-domain containing protein [Ascidiaceihabitans sp.]|uniref:CbtB domain-containing protein n=1 Tax=Ascidiaceihabitans sp. TaxID=1872644 RepID=UPI003296B441
MTTTTAATLVSAPQSRSAMIPALFALVLGAGILVLAGHVQAAALHDAAHDVRHATGFPCH